MAKQGKRYDEFKNLILEFLEEHRIDYAPTKDEIMNLDSSGILHSMMEEVNATSFDLWSDLELDERTSEAVLYSMVMRVMYKENINYIPDVFQMMKYEPEAMLYILEVGELNEFCKSKGLYTKDQYDEIKKRSIYGKRKNGD